MRPGLLVAALLIAACGSAGGPPEMHDPEPSRARAALATLTVTNNSTHRVHILYRFANRTAPEVGIGHVEPDSTAEMAPVPAGEPLLLIARTSAGTEVTDGPRTFPLDGSWTWIIDRAARFAPPQRQGS